MMFFFLISGMIKTLQKQFFYIFSDPYDVIYDVKLLFYDVSFHSGCFPNGSRAGGGINLTFFLELRFSFFRNDKNFSKNNFSTSMTSSMK